MNLEKTMGRGPVGEPPAKVNPSPGTEAPMADPIANPRGTPDLAEALSRVLQGVPLPGPEALALARHILNVHDAADPSQDLSGPPYMVLSEGFNYSARYRGCSYGTGLEKEGAVLLLLRSTDSSTWPWLLTVAELRTLLACAEAQVE